MQSAPKVTKSSYDLIKKLINVCASTNTSSTQRSDIVNRKIGVTDYAKFEQIAKEIEREDVLSKKDILNAINPNDIKKAKQVYEGSTKPKVEASVIFKNEGDYYLKRKLYENAVDAYEKALLQLFYTFNDNEEDKKVVETKKCAINLNLSMALMNLGRYKDAVGYLQEAKRLDVKNLKTIYRMSYCYFKMDNINEAKKYVNEGISLCDKKNNEFELLKEEICKKERESDRMAARLFKKAYKNKD
jgi:tetratricopeptide (TPR) repeat protein